MRKPVLFLASWSLVLFALAILSNPTFAQRDNSRVRSSPNAKVSQTIGTTEIDVHYSRPGVKERAVFGELVPWGETWRAGANEPTTVTVSADVMVGGKHLAAGSYALWIVPNEEGDWNVIFGKPVRWGTMHADSQEVLRISATSKASAHQEWLLYTFDDLTNTSATLTMHWAEVSLSIPFVMH